ncbi:hypothetical protein [Methanospirillum hungatei]|nr:hypothetical protein [Methanospirillum hungatei]
MTKRLLSSSISESTLVVDGRLPVSKTVTYQNVIARSVTRLLRPAGSLGN